MTDRLLGRNGQIWRDYVSGRTQEWIADKYDLSQGRVSQIISEVRDSIPQQTREELIAETAEMLRELRAETVELYRQPPVPLYSNGRPVLDEDGEQVLDHTYRLRALDSAIKLEDRLAKLLGLDAATKVEATVTADETAAMAQIAAEAAKRVAGEGA